MALVSISLFERTGNSPMVDTSITNIGLKSSGDPETTAYADYPIQRPTSGTVRSYTKNVYARIVTGDTPCRAPIITLSGSVTGSIASGYQGTNNGIKLYYTLRNTYIPPEQTATGTEWTGQTISPDMSTIDPTSATSRPSILAASTLYYTEFIVFQLEVASDPDWQEYGNIPELKFKIVCDEEEA